VTTALRFYVASLTDAECRAIHADGVSWEKTRAVADDSPLRQHANDWRHAAGLSNESSITLWMRDLLAEVWRKYAAPTLERTE
jgi:hypothetical protein